MNNYSCNISSVHRLPVDIFISTWLEKLYISFFKIMHSSTPLKTVIKCMIYI